MIEMTIDLMGLKELRAKLLQMEAGMAKQVLEAAGYAAALKIVNAAKEKCPVKTGTLRRSIHPEIIESSRLSVAVAVGTDVVYAKRIEYGFMDKRDSLGRLFHQPAQPFLRPAFDENRAVVEAEFARALNALVNR